jgi:hypothetical protein
MELFARLFPNSFFLCREAAGEGGKNCNGLNDMYEASETIEFRAIQAIIVWKFVIILSLLGFAAHVIVAAVERNVSLKLFHCCSLEADELTATAA